MFGPTISVLKTNIDGITKALSGKFPQDSQEISRAGRVVKDRVGQLDRMAVYVGIPESSADDRRALLDAAFQKISGSSEKAKRRRLHVIAAAEQEVTNAQLLFIHSNGSPMRGIPARPVLEPAIASAEGQAAINPEMAQAVRSALQGNRREAIRHLRRAGMAGRNVARRYFFAQNGWAPLKPKTIERKGSSQPLIDTGALRAAITFVVDES